MRPFCSVCTLCLCLVPGAGHAQTQASSAPSGTDKTAAVQPAAATTDPYKNEALVFEKSETTIRMRADGTGDRDVHVVMRIQSEGAAQQFGVLAFAYAAAYETPVIRMVRVHKADGSVVDTPAGDAIDMPTEVTREAPLYSDLKEKHLPVRSLSPGDRLEYEVDTAIDKPEAPGQFWGAQHFTPPGTIVVLAEILNLEVPADKYVQVWSPNHKFSVAEKDGVKTYTWDVPQLVTAPKSTGDDANKPTPPRDPDEDSDGRKLPSVAWTTFHNWQEVGAWYRSLALDRAQPTDAIRAKADEIVNDAKTPEDQVRALYSYVSQHNRYVGIDFGIGRYQPHGAAEVLANQYGDCKDKDTLLEALLHAKGFSTAPALIGAGIAPVPDVPSPAVFNHVITTVNLAGTRVWLDSTPQAAPYQYLSAIIRDEKALVIPADGAASLESTPAAVPYPFKADFEAVATLDADGKLTGKMTATYRDDDEVGVRTLAQNIAPAEWDKASQYLSSMTGFGGTTSNTEFEHADDNSNPIVLQYDYSRHPYGDWDSHRIVPLFPMLEFGALDSDTKAPEEDIQLGAPRTLVAVSQIRLPDGYTTDLPDPIHVKTDFATFDKTYRFDGKEIVAERTIVILKNKVPKGDWKAYQAFTKDISLTGEPWTTLLPPNKPLTVKVEKSPAPATAAAKPEKGAETAAIAAAPAGGTTPAAPAATSSAADSVSDLMQQAGERLRSGDLQGAKEALDKVKAKNPNQQYMWGMYGFIAGMERNFEDAAADYRKELAAHPDNPGMVMALAQTQNQTGDSVGARETLAHYFADHPDDLHVSLYLASLETTAEDYNSALKTLETAASHNPDNPELELQVSNALVRLNRNQEAAAAAESVLEGTDDPELLNDGAYTLSETGIDLPRAEEASRKSITKLEEASATMTAEQANSKAFGDANLLIASWDTLGWILYREGKLDEAQGLISAAWRSSLHAEVAYHLGQIDEAKSQKAEALASYTYADEAIDRTVTPDVRNEIHESLQRLRGAGVKSAPVESLQDLRTYKLSRPVGVGGWGTFRLEITTSGVIEAQQMSGESKIAGIQPKITAMKLPELLPPGSNAHLLRSAVVSCSLATTCEVVLVPDGGLQTERQ